MTKPEIAAKKSLQSLGFVVKPFNQKCLIDPYNCIYSQMSFKGMRIDFALISSKIAIEINGDYWHGSRLSQITPRQAKRKLDDATKEITLSKDGWKLLKIVASDINKKHFHHKLQRRIWGLMEI